MYIYIYIYPMTLPPVPPLTRGCEHANFDCVGSPESWELDHRVRCCDKGVKEASASWRWDLMRSEGKNM